MTTDPTPGARAVCSQCGAPIIYVGPYWSHEGEVQPRHIAAPWPPAPQVAQSPTTTFRATIALLRPSLSGEELVLIGTPREFSTQDWGLIVREVNDWLQMEVTPSWQPGQLWMDVVAVVAPSVCAAEILRGGIYGLAVAWGLQWQ